ncbi:MAG: hypothetical protein K0U40_07550 [Betaproteobacteria bacterium]|nr:hypothetical protein [Betaproteobacteria bacterium]
MKSMQKLSVALFTVFFSGIVVSESIVYNGFECQNATNANDATPTQTPLQSRFEVIDNLGEGIFRLNLTGGLPRFTNDNLNVCIDSDTAIGFTGIPARDGIPMRLDAIDATAFFTGQELIITISSINTDLSSGRTNFSNFTTSRIFPYTNTLIFNFNAQSSKFKLIKLIQNRGFINTSGSTASITPFLETIVPSFNDTAEDNPRVLKPPTNIEYAFE